MNAQGEELLTASVQLYSTGRWLQKMHFGLASCKEMPVLPIQMADLAMFKTCVPYQYGVQACSLKCSAV